MSALVGYGSSDEEDEAPPGVPSQASFTGSREHAETLANGQKKDVAREESSSVNVENVTDPSVPMVGPSMPVNGATTQQEYEEDSLPDVPAMPERDLLRYLTQPSHPMTSLPLEPTSDPDPAVTAKMKRFLELKSKGIHFNEDLATKSSFKNPNLFASLLERSMLPSEAQYVSTLPAELFSISSLPSWAYKEELLKSQQSISAALEATKKAQSAAGKRTIDFAPASRESTPGSTSKRKRP